MCDRLCGVCWAGDDRMSGGRNSRVYEGRKMGQSVDHGDCRQIESALVLDKEIMDSRGGAKKKKKDLQGPSSADG